MNFLKCISRFRTGDPVNAVDSFDCFGKKHFVVFLESLNGFAIQREDEIVYRVPPYLVDDAFLEASCYRTAESAKGAYLQYYERGKIMDERREKDDSR